ERVATASARSTKVALLADLLGILDDAELPIAVGLLSGTPRQGRIGIGYRTVYGIEGRSATEASLTIGDLDRALTAVEEATGTGSAAARRELLDTLLHRATEAESGFIRRLVTGELRQGASAGLMTDAVAKAAAVPGEQVRRALMLSGDLPVTAAIAMA